MQREMSVARMYPPEHSVTLALEAARRYLLDGYASMAACDFPRLGLKADPVPSEQAVREAIANLHSLLDACCLFAGMDLREMSISSCPEMPLPACRSLIAELFRLAACADRTAQFGDPADQSAGSA